MIRAPAARRAARDSARRWGGCIGAAEYAGPDGHALVRTAPPRSRRQARARRTIVLSSRARPASTPSTARPAVGRVQPMALTAVVWKR
jgi:hypothetical protein